jgi:hypothetical protein
MNYYFKITLISSMLLLSVSSFANDEDIKTDVFTSDFVTTVSLTVKVQCIETKEEKGKNPVLVMNNKKASKVILVLANGNKFDISWYNSSMKSWRLGDEIQVEYVGGWKAFFNPYKITNVNADDGKNIVWGTKYGS